MKRESDKIVSIAVLKAKAGMRERLRHELLALIAPTRREPGNLDYVLFELKDEPVDSTCQCNTLFKDLRWRFKFQGFPRSVV